MVIESIARDSIEYASLFLLLLEEEEEEEEEDAGKSSNSSSSSEELSTGNLAEEEAEVITREFDEDEFGTEPGKLHSGKSEE